MKKFPFILLISIIVGSILGLIFKSDILIIKPFGDIYINIMFTIVVPLVFFTITSSIAKMTNLKKLGKIFKNTFIVFITTSLLAAILMFIVMFFINPISTNMILEKSSIDNLDIGNKIVSMITVTDFYSLFSKSNMFPLIIFSILLGLALSFTKSVKVSNILDELSNACLKLVNIVNLYAPIGLCAYFACLVATYGPSLIGDYLKSIIIYIIVCILYFVIFYTLYAYISKGKKGVKQFYKNIFPSFITSLSTQSSLATLPNNLAVADKLDIDEDVKNISLPLGATMHMEGSSIGAILKICFLFTLFNINYTPITIISALLIAVLSAVVMAGIPGGGLIGEALIVSIYGFDNTAFLIIATIGILIDPPATMLNATGDVASCMLIDKMTKKGKKIN